MEQQETKELTTAQEIQKSVRRENEENHRKSWSVEMLEYMTLCEAAEAEERANLSRTLSGRLVLLWRRTEFGERIAWALFASFNFWSLMALICHLLSIQG